MRMAVGGALVAAIAIAMLLVHGGWALFAIVNGAWQRCS